MRVLVLSSGSSGNVILLETSTTRILVDAGVGPRGATQRLRKLGVDLFPRGVDAIIITHHHGDHCAQLEPMARALQAPKRGEGAPLIHLHAGIEAARVRHRYAVATYEVGRAFQVGDVTVDALALPHDAPQVALSFHAATHSLGLATDLGHAPAGLAAFLGACDTVFLEANYCAALLGTGPYPPALKRRVASDVGHLSNDQSAALAAVLVRQRTSRLVLCHLSRTNNEPRRALRTVRDACAPFVAATAIEALDHGETRAFDLAARPSRPMVQVTLPL